jgi:hypothetical protein
MATYKELTLEDISGIDENYQNFIPLLAAPVLGVGAIIGGKKQKQQDAKDAQRIAASQEAQRAEYEKNKGRVAKISVDNKTCNELDNLLVSVINQQADEYNLNESQKKDLEAQKILIEGKIKEQKCEEERIKAASLKIQEAEQKLAKVQEDKKAQQKKILTYAGIGIGGLIATIIIIKVLRA